MTLGPIETFDVRGLTVEIHADDDCENPREWCNVGTLVCFHRRYNLGDKHDYRESDYGSWDELADAILADHPGAELLGLHLYDHSGLYLSTTSWYDRGLPQGHAQFDSGQVGYAFITRETMLAEWGKKIVTKQVREKARAYLEVEVAVYADWLAGRCYGYIIKDEDDVVDSCWGYIGSEHVEQSAREAAEYEADALAERRAKVRAEKCHGTSVGGGRCVCPSMM